MDTDGKKKRVRIQILRVAIMLGLILAVQFLVLKPQAERPEELSYSAFKAAVEAGEVTSVSLSPTIVSGERLEGKAFSAIRVEDPNLLKVLEAHNVEVKGEVPSEGGLAGLLGWILPFVFLAGFYYFMVLKPRGGSSGGGIFSFGKSKPRIVKGEETGITFQDVGGAGEAATELQEVIEFLRNPARFQRLGGKMPKGVLLVGPPGTGKTLMAKATAGEAGVPFYSMSASEFVEMFVGVGASRVRDLFEQAKKTAPSIIFIDEIDAIGGRRAGAAAMGTHEEREQTLNQLLAEMDGFDSTYSVIVMAATNRPEVLDPALLRPGRFDRQITVDLPDLTGRERILGIHTRGVTLGAGVDLAVVARITPGFSGADLANLVNEAAILAARTNKDKVEMSDFDAAMERVVAGSRSHARAMTSQEKEMVATHEAGHAMVASLLPGMDAVHKVSIVPRGKALGYTWQRPSEDRYLMSESELEAKLAVLVAGRVAEAQVFSEVSTGAADDLARATDLARRMVTEFGMSPAIGPVRVAADPQAASLGLQAGLDTRISPQTAAQVDQETRRLVEAAVQAAWQTLERNRPALRQLTERLCEAETLGGEEVSAILAQHNAQPPRREVPQASVFACDRGRSQVTVGHAPLAEAQAKD